MNPPRIAFTTLGCKVNQSETDLLARRFAAAGYRCVAFEEPAEVYVVNTCTVTHVADRKSRQMLNQARRLNPQALVVAIGCYASIVGDALATEHTLVIRNRDKDRVLELVQGRVTGAADDLPYHADSEKYLDTSGSQVRSRALVKAQDGCDSHCTYCIIPRARGRSRSVAPEEVVCRVQALADEGHAEVVITGVDLGSYGEDTPDFPDLGGLLRRLLDETTVSRIRVSSLEPGDFDSSWLELWADTRLCRHLHVPLQSGSASVLQRMERTYRPQEFAAMVAACRRSILGITITTDVMVGFPGETDSEFVEGYDFIRAMRFDGMHVFKYSARSGTRAARMDQQVSDDTRAERSRMLREEAATGVQRLLARHEGMPAHVTWESTVDSLWRGLTDTNVRVYSSAPVRSGTLTRLRLGGPFRDGLWGEPAQADMPLVSVS
ncbi:MAG: tRNA (N(6)-L-threonylcarbamoyladenosine(37)-C(2))-methylthiotransferase MtaB [Chloroflexota bacterium]